MPSSISLDQLWRQLCLPCLLSLVSIGCGGGGPQADPVNVEQARQTLTEVLDAWKSGQSPDSLKEASPEVVVQDFDWKQGLKLTSYELLAPGEARDANWYCQVKLSLVDPRNRPAERTVTYIVGTDPVLTVFRQVLP